MDRVPGDGMTQPSGEQDGAADRTTGRKEQRARPRSSRFGGRGGPGDERQCLVRTIETEIIPRLMLVQDTLRSGRPGTAGAAGGDGAAPPLPEISEFVELVMATDVARAAAWVETVRADAASLEKICLELLAPAARRLGQMWEDDERNFAEVTLGMCRLQQLLRDFSDQLPGEALGRQAGLRVLLLPAPGEQHTFGLSMVMEFFRRAGWDVDGGPGMSLAEMRALVREDWFDIVGFSVSATSGFGPLTGCIRAVRKVSRNPSIGVMVGGKVFTEHPDLAAQVGADATAEDGRQAPMQAERLLAVLGRVQV
jgi:MerR family transcriptional regulator, light-induced transcriptional regulator